MLIFSLVMTERRLHSKRLNKGRKWSARARR